MRGGKAHFILGVVRWTNWGSDPSSRCISYRPRRIGLFPTVWPPVGVCLTLRQWELHFCNYGLLVDPMEIEDMDDVRIVGFGYK